jgi:rhamnose transport system permease protein
MIKKLFAIREVPVFTAFVILLIVIETYNHKFLSASGVHDILFGVAVVALLAVAESLVIVMRHVDLSVGSTIGLSAYLIGRESAHGHGLFYVLMVGLICGLLVGAANGFLVGYLRLPSLVVTLGTLYVVRGLFNQIAAGDSINGDQVPKVLRFMGGNTLFGIPYLFLTVIAFTAIVGWAMRNLRSGRDLYAIGSNPAASGLVGIPVARRTFFAFLSAGAITGLAGAVLLARFSHAEANSGLGIELTVVTACVVGGVAIAGGVGTVYGALIGALLLQTITLALGAIGVSQFWQGVVNGVLLVAAITLDKVLSSRVTVTRILKVPA